MQFLFTYDAIREIKTRDTRESNKVCKYGKILPLIYKAYCFHEDLVANKSDVKIYDQRKDIDTLLTHEKI